MSLIEKLFSIFAIISAFSLLTVLILYPEYRQLKILLPISLAGMLINVALMFLVLRDIFLRHFPSATQKYLWIFAVLFFWPTILYYLPRHGFRKRPKGTQ